MLRSNDFCKADYNTDVKLIESVEKDNRYFLRFQAVSTYHLNMNDIVTTVSEEVDIIYDFDAALITEFYTPFNYYDETLRGILSYGFEDLRDFAYTDEMLLRQDKLESEIYKAIKIESSSSHG